MQRTVTTVREREAWRAERDALSAWPGNVPIVGGVCTPHIQPCTFRRTRLARQHTRLLRQAGDVEHVHLGGKELVLSTRSICCPAVRIHASPWITSLTVKYSGTLLLPLPTR